MSGETLKVTNSNPAGWDIKFDLNAAVATDEMSSNEDTVTITLHIVG